MDNRDAVVPINEQDYTINDTLPIGELRSSDLEELGYHMSRDTSCTRRNIWKKTAENLGLPVDIIDHIENSNTQNPGYEVLKFCKSKPLSTVRVLRKVFELLQREDLVKKLDDILRSEVIIFVECCLPGGEKKNLSTKLPGKMTLREYFEFLCQQQQSMFSNVKRCTLKSTLGLRWNSPAKECQGIDIVVYSTRGKKQRQSEPLPPQPGIDIPKRGAISVLNERQVHYPDFDVSNSPEKDKLLAEQVRRHGTVSNVSAAATAATAAADGVQHDDDDDDDASLQLDSDSEHYVGADTSASLDVTTAAAAASNNRSNRVVRLRPHESTVSHRTERHGLVAATAAEECSDIAHAGNELNDVPVSPSKTPTQESSPSHRNTTD